MKIMAVIDGERTCIQVVKRGKTIYIRRCARTMYEPTEKQRAVRANVAITAIESYCMSEALKENLTREDINTAVRMAFAQWHRSPRKKPEIEEILEDEYGTEVQDVKQSYSNMKTYNYP
jgi:hypothetical protein